jgi:hypothetical protein
MNPTAKLYVHGVTGLGAIVIAAAFLNLRVTDPVLFALLAALATIGGALKMRVPGVEGNLSLSFLPIILSSVLLSLPETIALTVAATLVQTSVGVRKFRLAQAAFNCAALSISIGLGALAGAAVAGQHVPLIRLGLAGGVFYVANSVAIATAIGLTGNRPVLEIWDDCFRLYLPYFTSGLACALVAFTGSTADERRSLQYPELAVLPLMLLARHYFKTFGNAGANQRA